MLGKPVRPQIILFKLIFLIWNVQRHTYLYTGKGRREEHTPIWQFTPQTSPVAGIPSQEQGMSPRSFRSVAGTQLPQPSLLSPRVCTGKKLKSEVRVRSQTQACWYGTQGSPSETQLLGQTPAPGPQILWFLRSFCYQWGTFHHKWSLPPFSWVITSFVPLWIKICYICTKYWMLQDIK